MWARSLLAALVTLLLSGLALAEATKIKRGPGSGSGSPFEIWRRANATLDGMVIKFDTPYSIPFRGRPAPHLRVINTDAVDAEDTCDEACQNNTQNAGFANVSSCNNATLVNNLGVVSDSTCSTDVGTAASSIIMMCHCDEQPTNNYWETQTSTDITTPVTSAGGDGYATFFEGWTGGADDSWIQAQYRAVDNVAAQLGQNPGHGWGHIANNCTANPLLKFHFQWLGGFTNIDAGGTAGDMEQTEWFVGMAFRKTAAAGLAAGATDYIGFRKRDGTDDATNAIYFVTANNGTSATGDMIQTGAGRTVNDTGWVVIDDTDAANPGTEPLREAARMIGNDDVSELRFTIRCSDLKVEVYINGRQTANSPYDLTGATPDTVTFPSFYMENAESLVTEKAIWMYFMAYLTENNYYLY